MMTPTCDQILTTSDRRKATTLVLGAILSTADGAKLSNRKLAEALGTSDRVVCEHRKIAQALGIEGAGAKRCPLAALKVIPEPLVLLGYERLEEVKALFDGCRLPSELKSHIELAKGIIQNKSLGRDRFLAFYDVALEAHEVACSFDWERVERDTSPSGWRRVTTAVQRVIGRRTTTDGAPVASPTRN